MVRVPESGVLSRDFRQPPSDTPAYHAMVRAVRAWLEVDVRTPEAMVEIVISDEFGLNAPVAQFHRRPGPCPLAGLDKPYASYTCPCCRGEPM